MLPVSQSYGAIWFKYYNYLIMRAIAAAWQVRALLFFLCIEAYGVLLQTCALNDRSLIEPEQLGWAVEF